MATETAPRRGRRLTETVIERRTKPGRPLLDAGQTPENGQVVRRLVDLELELDRQLRQVVARDGLTLKRAINVAVRDFVAKAAS